MVITAKPLRMMTAADLMSRGVVVIPEEMSVRAAAHLLSQARISGAPVVDAEGRCVGVLSATDFVRLMEKGEPTIVVQHYTEPCYCSDWQVVDVEELPADEVRTCMTPDPVTVSSATPVAELARQMLDAHIHRIVVVDRERRPIGIVSSMDILAAVARQGN